MNPDEEESSEDLNLPDMAGVEYQVAMETIAKMYYSLRNAGLGIDDAAAIMAAVMTRSGTNGQN